MQQAHCSKNIARSQILFCTDTDMIIAILP